MNLLGKLLEEALNAREILEEKASLFKNEVVFTYAHHFESEKGRVSFFYPNLDLSKMVFTDGSKGRLLEDE